MSSTARKVLIIDDDRQFAGSIKDLLAADGYDVHMANNGSDGYAMAEKILPALIVLDVMMDHTTEGFEVSRRLRLHRTLRTVPIVMVTGICRELNLPFQFETDSTFLPVTRVVEKPVDPRVLLSTIEQILAATPNSRATGKGQDMNTVKKALIVDDDRDYAAGIAEILKAEGYQVALAEDGVKGLAKAREMVPNVVMLDVMMENSGAGLDVVRALRDDAKLKSAAVILATGIRKPENLLDSYAPGESFPNVKKVFEKPVEPTELLKVLKNLR